MKGKYAMRGREDEREGRLVSVSDEDEKQKAGSKFTVWPAYSQSPLYACHRMQCRVKSELQHFSTNCNMERQRLHCITQWTNYL